MEGQSGVSGWGRSLGTYSGTCPKQMLGGHGIPFKPQGREQGCNGCGGGASRVNLSGEAPQEC